MHESMLQNILILCKKYAVCVHGILITTIFDQYSIVIFKTKFLQTDKQIRIKDIARRCGVSTGTVDRVLHHRGEVAPETREKVLKVIGELGFQPNILASTLALNKPILFSTLLPTPPSSDGYWNRPQIGIQKRSDELHHYRLKIESFNFDQSSPADFEDKASQMLDTNPDGIILAPYFYKESLPFVARLREKNIPFVFIDSDIADQGQLAYVGQNSFQCGFLSARLLSVMVPFPGNMLVLHFAKEMDNQNHLIQREKGFYYWFSTNEPRRKITTVEIGFTESEMYMDQILSIITSNGASGIFVTNSRVHLAAAVLERSGLRNVRLIGHDLLKENVAFLKKGWVDFLICQRPEEQGYNALDTLFRFVVQKTLVNNNNYTPIDIIVKENVDFYKEFK
jgi:LacI family transcriptional regulator